MDYYYSAKYSFRYLKMFKEHYNSSASTVSVKMKSMKRPVQRGSLYREIQTRHCMENNRQVQSHVNNMTTSHNSRTNKFAYTAMEAVLGLVNTGACPGRYGTRPCLLVAAEERPADVTCKHSMNSPQMHLTRPCLLISWASLACSRWK